MKRYPLMIAFAAVALGLLAGTAHKLRAETHPSDGEMCYHNLWTCSDVDDNGYWSQCDPSGPTGTISAAAAKAICQTYNAP